VTVEARVMEGRPAGRVRLVDVAAAEQQKGNNQKLKK
jgi:hypothetical protein